MSFRAKSLSAALVAAGLVLAGCSGGNGSGDSKSADPSSTGTSSDGSTPSDTPSPDTNAAYGLKLPPGVQLTPLGTELTVGDTARLAWQPDKKTVGVLAVTVTKLRKGSIKDFAGFTLDDRTKQSTPYYVDAKVKNIGKSDLSGMATPLYLVDGKDVLVEASTFQSTFSPCAARPLPKKFTAGKSTSVCLVYIAADHGILKAVSFRPTQKYAPITWTGPLTKDKPKKKSGKNSGG